LSVGKITENVTDEFSKQQNSRLDFEINLSNKTAKKTIPA